jgi:hypothetical protein
MIPGITAIAISYASLHFPYTDQNQFNPGIHLEAKNARAGVYLNSHDRVTGYVGYSLSIGGTQVAGVPINFGVLGALGSGYRSPIIGGLELRVGAHFTVLAVPGIKNVNSTALGFAVRLPLERNK